MLQLQSLTLRGSQLPPNSSTVASYCHQALPLASPKLGQKEPATAPALEQHKSDGEAVGDVATGRAGVPGERGQSGGSESGSARESLPSWFQNWLIPLEGGWNESGAEGREGHSRLQKEPLQRKVRGGEHGLGGAGLGRRLGQFPNLGSLGRVWSLVIWKAFSGCIVEELGAESTEEEEGQRGSMTLHRAPE